MKVPKKLIFHEDPAHGWLAVKRQLLVDLGIADKVSSFSYQKGETVYLEEDCDLGLFLDELERRGIERPVLERRHKDNTPIRRYAAYKARNPA